MWKSYHLCISNHREYHITSLNVWWQHSHPRCCCCFPSGGLWGGSCCCCLSSETGYRIHPWKPQSSDQWNVNVTEWRHVAGTSTHQRHHSTTTRMWDLGTYNKQQQHEARVSIHTAIYIFQTATITSATTTQPSTTRKILPFDDDEATASSSFCVTTTTSSVVITPPTTTTVPDYTHPCHHHIQFTCIIHIGNGMASTDDYSCVHTT